jgi:hypothetical protein
MAEQPSQSIKEGWAERDGRRACSPRLPQPSGRSPRTSKAPATPCQMCTFRAQSARHDPCTTCDEWTKLVRNRTRGSVGTLGQFCAPAMRCRRATIADLARVVPLLINSMFTRSFTVRRGSTSMSLTIFSSCRTAAVAQRLPHTMVLTQDGEWLIFRQVISYICHLVGGITWRANHTLL